MVKSTAENLSPTRVKLTVEVPFEEVKPSLDKAYKDIANQVQIPGFRKGKVPMAMLKKQFGPRVMGDAMQEAIDSALRNHLETSGDRPATQPKVEMQNGETWKEGDDVVVNVSYEALPAIPEVDLTTLTLEKLSVPAEEAAVAASMERAVNSSSAARA